ncbi:MAG: alkanesulfonate monooxygenase SsuD [Gammaproteobacteria bacterium]|jgi:alkanesulfonate monooxygenase SsuD/methylene tetrahydromethanopterin reductase-like flavin-dependent oxidoreductase (luciferase family)
MPDLPIDSAVRFGVSTQFPFPEAARSTMELVERFQFDSVWVGDHIEFASPILDPVVQLALAAAYPSTAYLCIGVYLLPLRHPVAVAKQIATLDRVSNARLIFGVGIGGEFPNEFAAVQVPVKERGARLTESMVALRNLWGDAPVAHDGKYYSFPAVNIQPGPLRPGGPPMWCGGRQPKALQRIGEHGDGWLSYVVSPQMYRDGLETIARSAEAAGRQAEAFPNGFGTGHVLFAYIDDDRERAFEFASQTLSERYGMDFSSATKRYVAYGRPEDVAERIAQFHAAGVRHFALDWLATDARRDEQMQRFSEEVRPLLSGL